MTEGEGFGFVAGLIIVSLAVGNYISEFAGWMTLGGVLLITAIGSMILRYLDGPKRKRK